MSNVDELAAALKFLSTASRALASSFDYERTTREVADLAVDRFLEYCAVVTFDEPRAAAIVAERGSATFADFPPLSRVGALPGSTSESLGFIHLVDVPLIARDVMLGVLRVGRTCDPFSANDMALVDDLALRIAVTIDSARIFAREHHVADTLQRALLPERLPQQGSGRCHAAYLPGAKEAIVGGDWYDAFELPDGTIALSIGDVAGHGLRAAVVMGEVRQAFRAAALNPKSPSEVLERANMILNMRQNPTMVTALFGIYDPATRTLCYATAGHPAPILASRSGLVNVLPSDGIPLGVALRIEASDWRFTLPPGSLLALYTDGMIEYDRDPVAGEAALVAAVAAEVCGLSSDPARSLQRRIFADRSNTDDVATLTLSIEERVPAQFTFEFSAIPLAVPFVRHALTHYLETLGVNEDDYFAVVTAAGEAIANAVEHAYGASRPGVARVVAERSERLLSVTIEDQGRWKPAQRREERGRGLPMMRALMDGVEIRSNAQSTIVRLTKQLGSPLASAI